MILLLRHGRTEANARGLLLGRADPELDDEGRRQAVALAAAVRATTGGRVSRVVSSPLLRCRQTAAAVAEALGSGSGERVLPAQVPVPVPLPVTVDDRWIELDYGKLEGLRVSEIVRDTRSAWSADLSWAPEGGESLAALGERVRAACDALAGESGAEADGDVVVVTHVSPIKAAVAWALEVGDEVAWRMFVAPASITRIAVSGSGSRRALHSFNEIAHLG